MEATTHTETLTTTETLDRYSTVTLRSGKVAVLDNSTRRHVVILIGTADEADEFIDQWVSYMSTCECEQDWNCPAHAARVGTWIETRYDDILAAEPEWAQ